MKVKLTKFILPYTLVSTGFLLIYSSFYWLVFIRLKLIDFNSTVFSLFVPFAISTILIWFYFRKKLWLLDTNDKHREFTLFMAWILLVVPVLTFQFYLERETGELTHLSNVKEILTNKPTMYYSIENSMQQKGKSGFYVAKALVDRGNEIGVACYFACPLTNTKDSISSEAIWIGTMFGAKFSNRLFDDKEKQARLISKFVDTSVARYNRYEYKTDFLKRLSNSDERDSYLKAIQQSGMPYSDRDLIILKEETGTYQSRSGTSLWWTIFTLITSNLVWTLLTVFTKLKNKGKSNTL